jgi:serine/threonine-protein kinase RsbW
MTQTAETTRAVSLTVPAKPDYVVLARLALGAVCRLAPLSPEDVGDLKLAMTEAAALAVASPRAEGADAAMRFTFEVHDDRIVLEVSGVGDPTLAEEERELSTAIIEATVDTYERTGDTMTLVKLLRAPSE